MMIFQLTRHALFAAGLSIQLILLHRKMVAGSCCEKKGFVGAAFDGTFATQRLKALGEGEVRVCSVLPLCGPSSGLCIRMYVYHKMVKGDG
jgi:hypothetical protein